MSHPDKNIEITNIKHYLISEHDYLVIGECTDKQRMIAEVLSECVDKINEAQKCQTV